MTAALDKLVYYFGYVGLASVAVWAVAAVLCALFVVGWRRSLICWTALILATGGVVLTRINSAYGFSEHSHAARQQAALQEAEDEQPRQSDETVKAKQDDDDEKEPGDEVGEEPDDEADDAPADPDDSNLLKEIEKATQLTYEADTNAGRDANKPGWADAFADGKVRFIRLEYKGPDWDDGMEASEGADANFLAEFKRLAGGIECARKGESHPVSHLRKYPKGQAPPFVYMTGSGAIDLKKSDIDVLREYLRGGGMLFADAGSRNWDRNFRTFSRALFPGNPLIAIADDDPIFQIPFNFPNGPPPLWSHGGKTTMGVKYKGRWAIFYFPGDLNDAWKTGNSGLDRTKAKAAFRLGANVVYYSFMHYLDQTRKHRK